MTIDNAEETKRKNEEWWSETLAIVAFSSFIWGAFAIGLYRIIFCH